MNNVPVITIDGPSGVGKGTVSRALARAIKWHLMPSGDVYRVLAYLADLKDLDPDNPAHTPGAVEILQRSLQISFDFDSAGQVVIFNDEQLIEDDALRDPAIGQAASKWSARSEVRLALLNFFHAARKEPGLVYEGRDGATVVFPEAPLKVYLDASAEVRAERMVRERRMKGKPVAFEEVLTEIKIRDERDTKRDVAPLKKSPDSFVVNTEKISPDKVLMKIMLEAESRKLLR